MRAPVLLAALVGLVAFVAPVAAQSLQRAPRINYMTNCQGCHLPSGEGMAGKVPPMRGQLANFLLVPGGREFLVRVPGVANSTLNDADLAALMNWLVPAMGPALPQPFKPYTAQEVGALRRMRLQDVRAARNALIQKMPAPTRMAMAEPPTP
ncbi:c-type cytochrome [Sandarakinorhabdus cyanobacteriorum]|uniref:c-type cytochrome n=1 Tax=Sandarakinorhabdus cyanobacteriorum TaxID=1981098 RepID=UPI001A9C5338|nr:cytochrome C [Sandarakinorhabdus cyanobacteriorum]